MTESIWFWMGVGWTLGIASAYLIIPLIFLTIEGIRGRDINL